MPMATRRLMIPLTNQEETMAKRSRTNRQQAIIIFVLFILIPIIVGLVCYYSRTPVGAQRPPHTTCMEEPSVCFVTAPTTFDGANHFGTASLDYNMDDGCYRMQIYSVVDDSTDLHGPVTIEWFQGYDAMPNETYVGRGAIVDYDMAGQGYVLVDVSSCVEDHAIGYDVLINGESPLDAGAMFESTAWETFDMDGAGVNELAVRISGPAASNLIGPSATFISWLGHESASGSPILFDISHSVYFPAVLNGNHLP